MGHRLSDIVRAPFRIGPSRRQGTFQSIDHTFTNDFVDAHTSVGPIRVNAPYAGAKQNAVCAA
jgi:hypothetical protein